MATTKKKKRSSTAKTTASTAAVAALIIPTKYPYQTLYAKRVDLYVKIPSERAKKIAYWKQEKFNGIIMYGIDGVIMSTSYWSAIRAFIRELRAAGVKYVALAYSNKNVVNFFNQFQDSASITENFDECFSEIEPWVSSSGVTWPAFIDALSSVRAWGSTEADRVLCNAYLGWPQKPTGTNFSQNVKDIIVNTDRSAWHCYVYPKPKASYMVSRYTELAKQALLLGYSINKKFKPINIYSAEIDFSQGQFKVQTPEQMHAAFITEWNALPSFPGKEILDLSFGFAVFKDTDLMVSRPPKV